MVRVEHLVERAGVEHVVGPGLEVSHRRLAYTFHGFGRQVAEPARQLPPQQRPLVLPTD